MRAQAMSFVRVAAPAFAAVAIGAPASGQVLYESRKLLPANGGVNAHFGSPIVCSDGVVYIGAKFDNEMGSQAGAVYLFDLVSGEQKAKLVPDADAFQDYFGESIAVGGGVVAVGAPNDDDVARNAGAVYIFDAQTGDRIGKLFAEDGAPHDLFGCAVAVEGSTLVVGADSDNDHGFESGAVYIFDLELGAQVRKVTPDDGAAYDAFGGSIAIHQGIIAVGAQAADVNGEDSGAVYVFDAATGGMRFKCVPTDGVEGDRFGSGVSLGGGLLAAGSMSHDVFGPGSGAAYVFDLDSGRQLGKLTAGDGDRSDHFGGATRIVDASIVVSSAWNDGAGEDAGAAYLFDATTLSPLAKLIARDGGSERRYFGSPALVGGFAVVGATGDDTLGLDAGAAYVLDLRCAADIDHDGMLSANDAIKFFEEWAGGGLLADWSIDGVRDIRDVLAFLEDWSAGCH
jgi:hypothetical protein